MAEEALFDGQAIDLATVLSAREARVARRREVLAERRSPVVSLTVVMPGPVKDCRAARLLDEAALAALPRVLAANGWDYEIVHRMSGLAGPEALVAVAADAGDLKRAMIRLEDGHPLGRLWDLDVEGPLGGPLSRRSLGHDPRRCLVCGAPAHACARSRAHSLAELRGAMKGMIDAAGPLTEA